MRGGTIGSIIPIDTLHIVSNALLTIYVTYIGTMSLMTNVTLISHNEHTPIYAQCNCITRTLVYSQGDQSTLESQ
jgi:hypothetical protein